ncbi:MAG: hypothetical protein ACKVJK_22640 [Methylophagaceae bacterium]|mgnify:FL=1|jgi:hypothetical protein|tara:strand:+ start:3398 stop:3655 length:258 start_codon:yes stop_codon:yes gene_type:complete
MSYKLTNNQIKDDLTNYKEAISRITNPNVKIQFETIFNDLVNQLNFIEEAHNSYNNGYIDPRQNRENVIRMIDCRKKLNKLLNNA